MGGRALSIGRGYGSRVRGARGEGVAGGEGEDEGKGEDEGLFAWFLILSAAGDSGYRPKPSPLAFA